MKGIILFGHGARAAEYVQPFERIREAMNTALQKLPQVAATLGVQEVLPASEADYQKVLDYRQEAIEYGFAELA